jgi:peptide/nickel transport system substrate-binding protein
MWKAGIGIFTPGTPMANDAGLDVITRPRDMQALRAAMKTAGYQGESVLLMAATDNPILAAQGDVCNDLLKQLGMNVDFFTSDWGTVVQRRASKERPEHGGWNMFNTTWAGLDTVNPVVMQVLRTDGDHGFFGWPNMPELTALREQWLDAPDLAAQKSIAEKIQAAALQLVPFLPTGQYFYNTANRRSLKDVVDGQFVFWSVKRA